MFLDMSMQIMNYIEIKIQLLSPTSQRYHPDLPPQ
jgi:hypothetical protein